MTLPLDLRTDRLRLRRWLPFDRTPFVALNADPQVMEPTAVETQPLDGWSVWVNSR